MGTDNDARLNLIIQVLNMSEFSEYPSELRFLLLEYVLTRCSTEKLKCRNEHTNMYIYVKKHMQCKCKSVSRDNKVGFRNHCLFTTSEFSEYLSRLSF